jgi:hypothetical protein
VTAVVLHANEKPMVEFRYAEDGRLVTGINTLLSLRSEDRTGSEPHRFDATLCALEADPDSDDYGPWGSADSSIGSPKTSASDSSTKT